jgi:hypothetical protein
MAWRFTLEAQCDKCFVSLVPENLSRACENIKTVSNLQTLRWCIQRQWQRDGVMQGMPNLFGKKKMYCRKCAGN